MHTDTKDGINDLKPPGDLPDVKGLMNDGQEDLSSSAGLPYSWMSTLHNERTHGQLLMLACMWITLRYVLIDSMVVLKLSNECSNKLGYVKVNSIK